LLPKTPKPQIIGEDIRLKINDKYLNFSDQSNHE